jgi:hypothetical protein
MTDGIEPAADPVALLEDTNMAYETFFWFRAVLAVLLLGYAANAT